MFGFVPYLYFFFPVIFSFFSFFIFSLLSYIVVAAGLQGLAGGYAVYLAMVFAYAADITSTTTDQDIVATTIEAEEERQQHVDWSSKSTILLDQKKRKEKEKEKEKEKKRKNPKVGRSSSFGLVESMLYLGNIIGPLVAAQFAVGNSRSLLIRGLLLECSIAIILLAYRKKF